MDKAILDVHVRVSREELAELHRIAAVDLSPVTQVVRRMIRAGILAARAPTKNSAEVTQFEIRNA